MNDRAHRLGGWIFLWVGMALVWTTAAQAAPSQKTYALVVANNASINDGVPELKFADDDGARYFELFGSLADEVSLLTTLDSETQRLYPGLASQTKPPTRDNIQDTLAKLRGKMRAEQDQGVRAVLFVVFVGHGAIDEHGQGYLSLVDGMYTRENLLSDVVTSQQADLTHLIIDACNAYFMVRERGGDKEDWEDGRSGQTYDTEFRAFLEEDDVLKRHPRVGVLLSTAGAAEVHEWERYRGGVFSHEVRSGLLGAADVDGDMGVSYQELEAYLAAANMQVTNPRARIHFFAHPPAQDRYTPLMSLQSMKASALLSIEPQVAGRYYIEDSRGLRYADFHTSNDTVTHVALLESAPHYFVRSADQEVRIDSTTARGGVVRLAEQEFVPRSDAARGTVDENFRASLFATAFGRGFYEGYQASLDQSFNARLPRRQSSRDLFALELQVGTFLSEAQLRDLGSQGVQSSLELGVGFWLSPRFALEIAGAYGYSGLQERKVVLIDDTGERLSETRSESVHFQRLAIGAGARYRFALGGAWSWDLQGRVFQQWLLQTERALLWEGEVFGDPLSWRGEANAILNWRATRALSMGLRVGVSANVGDTSQVDERGNPLGTPNTSFEVLPHAGLQLGYSF